MTTTINRGFKIPSGHSMTVKALTAKESVRMYSNSFYKGWDGWIDVQLTDILYYGEQQISTAMSAFVGEYRFRGILVKGTTSAYEQLGIDAKEIFAGFISTESDFKKAFRSTGSMASHSILSAKNWAPLYLFNRPSPMNEVTTPKIFEFDIMSVQHFLVLSSNQEQKKEIMIPVFRDNLSTVRQKATWDIRGLHYNPVVFDTSHETRYDKMCPVTKLRRLSNLANDAFLSSKRVVSSSNY